MKTLWSILSVLAVAHLLAIGGIIAYLVFTGRLDADRMRDLRTLMSETGTQRAARLAEAEIKASRDAAAAQLAAKVGTPPVTSTDALDLKLQQSQVDLTRLESLKRDVQILQDTLRRERAALDADRA